jgi:hypothetical protein
MNNKLTHLPKLLKRKHILKDIGLSESLYYKLVKENKLPTIKINNRIYLDRDKLLLMIEKDLINIDYKGIETNE